MAEIVFPKSPGEFKKNWSDFLSKDKTPIIIGCNYHTTWQSHRAMRFVLCEFKGDRARLKTRETERDFWTNISDLIFITTNHNMYKALNKLRISEAKL
jgi:hypothetical protein